MGVKKTLAKEFYMTLIGKERIDGDMFVTSPQAKVFSAVVSQGEEGWNAALKLLEQHIRENVGIRVSLRLIPDAEQLNLSDISDRETPRLSTRHRDHVPTPEAHVIGNIAA